MNQSRTQKVFPRNISTTQASKIWLEASQRNEQSWRETLCIRRAVVCFSNSSSGVDAGRGRPWDPAGSSVGTLIAGSGRPWDPAGSSAGTLIMSVSAGRGNKYGATVTLPRLQGTAGATSLPSAMTLHVPNLQHTGKQIRPLPISEVRTSIPFVQNASLSLLYRLRKGHRELQ